MELDRLNKRVQRAVNQMALARSPTQDESAVILFLVGTFMSSVDGLAEAEDRPLHQERWSKKFREKLRPKAVEMLQHSKIVYGGFVLELVERDVPDHTTPGGGILETRFHISRAS